MDGRWIDHDLVEVPMTALDEKTYTVGDGLTLLRSSDELFDFWAEDLEAAGLARPARGSND